MITAISNTPYWRIALIAMVAVTTMLVASPATAKKIGAATVPDSMTIGTLDIPFLGGGQRTRAVFKLYAAALYSNETGEGKSVADADEPMAIHLHILSKLINRKKMVSALKTGFNNATGGNTASIQSGIDQMLDAMNANPLGRGMKYTLIYEPGVGTTMQRNGEDVVLIEGLEFKQALFGIWLGDKPAQTALKARMLGK